MIRRRLWPAVLAIALVAPLARAALAAPTATKPPPAKPPPKAPPAVKVPPPPPLPPLALLPSIARVKVTSHGNHLAVVEEINLPRGDWAGTPLRFHVAFGAPGPRAIDARLLAVGDGELEVEDDARGEVLTTERVPHRPPSTYPLLGHDTMAGVVVTIPADVFAKALTDGNMATLRIRALVDATEDKAGALSTVVRLGASRGTPLTLGRITAATSEGTLARAEAKLCGPEADAHPLAVGLVPPAANREARGNLVAPVLAVRHASDDLCVRLWHVEPPAR